ncbi:hypothetical protein GCM10020331_087080 [Ectobacillus funiculus]
MFGDIEIVIKDNGVGIEAERLQEIKGQLQSNIDYPLEAKREHRCKECGCKD